MAVAPLHAGHVVQLLLEVALVVEARELVGGPEPLELPRAHAQDLLDGVGLHRAEDLGEALDGPQRLARVERSQVPVERRDHHRLERGDVADELNVERALAAGQLGQALRPLDVPARLRRRVGTGGRRDLSDQLRQLAGDPAGRQPLDLVERGALERTQQPGLGEVAA
jgi:hypothetical protein